MPNVTTQYRMFVPRRRRIGGGGAAIDLVPASVNFVTGDAHATAPDTIDLHYPNPGSPNAPANFAFWSVVGSSDGELALWVDDALVGDYKPGAPHGRWLRDNFYTWGPYYQDMGPFEGFDFRSSADVLVKRITLDAYYVMGSLDARIAAGLAAPETQTILYDDVVVATSRIGCK